MRRTANISVFLTIGLLILGIAIFARQFGLDTNPGWSKGRIALLLVGMLTALAPWVLLNRSRAQISQSDLFALPVLLFVIAVYFWFVTVSHNTTSNYYSLLAASFRRGELSLPLKPDPALLELRNPYDPAERQGVKAPVDLSLYNGKFYLYWGPAPAALLAVVQRFLHWEIAEVDLLFLFMCGIFLSQYLLIVYLWERFFREVPRWMLILSILLAGFANPALWLLSQPKIYEAAIAGAQFFFIAGFLSAVLALDRVPASPWKLAVAGSLWALAALTRSVAVLPVLFMTLMVVYWLFKTRGESFIPLGSKLISLGLPLLIGALGFGWYNWARFGSLLETGFTYQLAAPFLQQHMHELFSPAYILQNIYNYLFHPFLFKESFPFLYPMRGATDAIFPGQGLPEFYTAQAVTGFVLAVPFTLFAIGPMMRLLQARDNKEAHNPGMASESVSLAWITVSLLGSFLLPFVSLLIFFWAAMRYAEDFMPALTLLSIIGFWQAYQSSARRNKGKIYATLGALLAGVSIISAVLLALSIYYNSGLLGK